MTRRRRGGLRHDVLRAVCSALCTAQAAIGAPLSEHEAIGRMAAWMPGHPVMKAAAGYEVQETVSFPAQGAPYSVFVVTLSPNGYAVLNSDDRLPLVVAFSASSGVSLAELPDNAFRAALLVHVDQAATQLAELGVDAAPDLTHVRTSKHAAQSTELHGPYLETTWNQCNPYNLDCPNDPQGSEYYGYRVATGCTPTAYAQVLRYHRWPLHGQGSHSYTDSEGSITGTHGVSFNDPFGWSAMRMSYDPWAASEPGDAEVADLMYRLGVAAEADYESDGTDASIQDLGARVNAHLYYEAPVSATTQAALLPALNADLRAGYPAVVGIPGHSIVADGLLNDGGTVSYHINYGWGGSNNGWWSANGVPGGAISYGTTSIRPELMAFPQEESVAALVGEPFELNWLLPVRRESEASRLLIQRLAQQSGGWSSGAENFDHAASTGWQVRSGGRSGNCWFAGPNGYKALVLADRFVPSGATSFTFWLKYLLSTSTFRISVSADGGRTYSTPLFERTNGDAQSWQSFSVNLGAYAGQQICIRFELTESSSYYPSGGVWLDDLSVGSGNWFRWATVVQDSTLASRRFSEQRTVLDACSGFSGDQVTSTTTYKDWAIATNGTERYFYKQPGGYANSKYHLTSYSTLTPGPDTRLLMRWKRDLASDRFRVLVSQNRSTFTEIWSEGGTSDWAEQAIPLGAYAGQAIYLRLEYMVDGYYPDGGVWVDTLWLQEVEHLELEGQPIHYTVLTDELSAGTYTLATVLEDAGGAKHLRSPAFALTLAPLFDHRVEGNGSATLTGYHGSGSRLEIPAVWSGRAVAGIAANAIGSASLVNVRIPASVTSIETGAFNGASALSGLFFEGNAPSLAANALAGTAATVYYLPGATGWTASLGGRPTRLWNPAPDKNAVTGFQGGFFGFTLSGTASIPVRVQRTASLVTGEWTTLTNTALGSSGAVYVSDPESPTQSTRFYRCVWP